MDTGWRKCLIHSLSSPGSSQSSYSRAASGFGRFWFSPSPSPLPFPPPSPTLSLLLTANDINLYISKAKAPCNWYLGIYFLISSQPLKSLGYLSPVVLPAESSVLLMRGERRARAKDRQPVHTGRARCGQEPPRALGGQHLFPRPGAEGSKFPRTSSNTSYAICFTTKRRGLPDYPPFQKFSSYPSGHVLG